MPAETYIDEEGQERYVQNDKPAVYAKDGRLMNPNSLYRIEQGIMEPHFKPGQSGNPAGRPKDPVREYRDVIREIAFSKLSPKDTELAIERLIKRLFRRALQTDSDAILRQFADHIQNGIDGRSSESRSGTNAPSGQFNINSSKVLILPAQNGRIERQNDRPPQDVVPLDPGDDGGDE